MTKLRSELTTASLAEAFLARRVIATTGARIALRFESDDAPMGSELPFDAARAFDIRVQGTSRIESVELLRNGRPAEVLRLYMV